MAKETFDELMLRLPDLKDVVLGYLDYAYSGKGTGHYNGYRLEVGVNCVEWQPLSIEVCRVVHVRYGFPHYTWGTGNGNHFFPKDLQVHVRTIMIHHPLIRDRMMWFENKNLITLRRTYPHHSPADVATNYMLVRKLSALVELGSPWDI